jgi:hypothetical protein
MPRQRMVRKRPSSIEGGTTSRQREISYFDRLKCDSRTPTPNVPGETRGCASEVLDLARANQDPLVQHGMSATLLDALDAALKGFDVSLQETDDGKQSHVAARAEMKTLSDEISRPVGMLDGFNRYRFHLDPELIVAWQSAKHVVSSPQSKAVASPVPPADVEKPAA